MQRSQTFTVNLAAQPSKVVDFPQIPWWRCGRSVILTAGTLLARILCGLYSNGNHFGAGGEAVFATPWHLPLGHNTVDFCVRELGRDYGGLPDRRDRSGMLLTVEQIQLRFIVTDRNEQCNSETLCGWIGGISQANQKNKTLKASHYFCEVKLLKFDLKTVSFIHRKSRVFLWLGLCCHLEVILHNIQNHSGFELPNNYF